MYTNQYVIDSLELHLYFGRIMKEHSLFLRAGFTPANPDFSEKAEFYLKEFEEVLSKTVALSNGAVSKEVLCSGEVITEFTSLAEEQTECLTGIPIDRAITARTEQLQWGKGQLQQDLHAQVQQLNRRAIRLLNGLIELKETILCKVLQGEMFTANYPMLIEHILREAKLYRRYLQQLERNGALSFETKSEVETFWNQIMMEHAMFIRGMLDPCETELMDTADGFAKKFCASAPRRTKPSPPCLWRRRKNFGISKPPVSRESSNAKSAASSCPCLPTMFSGRQTTTSVC